MFNFLKKSSAKLVAPVDGRCIHIEQVSDPAFSSKIMGGGFAVVPTGDTVVSPVDGEIVALPGSMHAVGLHTDGGEVLVHIGIDTVMLGGRGFKALKSKGSRVKAGTPMIRFDSKVMSEGGLDMTTIVVFTEGESPEILPEMYDKQVKAGQPLLP